MPKNRRASAKRDKFASGEQAVGSRRATPGRRRSAKRRGLTAAGRAQLSGAAHRVAEEGGARRLLAEARDMAQSVGHTTVGTAKGIASGARNAAFGVARTTGRTASDVAGHIKRNPWPALLIGAGATWVTIDAIRGDSETGRGQGGRRAGQRGRSKGAGYVAKQAAAAVADAGRTVGVRVEQFVRDNPVLAGAATLGLGVAVGLALPTTETENKLFGNAREEMIERAKEAARGTVRSVRDVAESSVRKMRG